MSTIEKLAMFGLGAAVLGLILSNPIADVSIANSLFSGYTSILKTIQMH